MKENKSVIKMYLISIIGVLILIGLLVTAIVFGTGEKQTAKTLPSAETLLSTINIPQFPNFITQDTVKMFLSQETSLSIDANLDVHYVEKKNQTTWDYTYRLPVSGTLQICSMDDGRSMISVGGVADYSITGPYIDHPEDGQKHYEKSYFLIINDTLEDADIYMREVNPESVSANDIGSWQFVNDRDIDIQAVIDEYNKNHTGDYTDSASMNTATEAFKVLLSNGSTVTEGNYKGLNTIILNNKLDFRDEAVRKDAQMIFEYLESFNSEFRHYNISQFLEYYGDFVVIKLNIFFTDNGDGTYSPYVVRIDLSESRIMDYLAKRSGKKLSEVEKYASFDINSAYVDIIILPQVPSSIKENMQALIEYTDERLIEKQYENIENETHEVE